ncbi:hypothetical protein BFJ72_g8621 [Fusarium proliferatum]|uniref:Uncharacterized protein n=1 Tax=Gibberella intermedia TaxID=948311 RepID=A0A420T2Y5_GIBIN|nr:hypothetical protein BFJ72_g8621 [Fusarium proliferatum]
MSQSSALDKHQLVTMINNGSFVLGDLSIDRCPKLETGEVSREVLKQVYTRMVDEVFKTFHLNKTEAMLCFKRCVKKLVRGEPLQATSLDEYNGWNKVKKHLQTAMDLQSRTWDSVCIPAPHLVSIIVLLTIRRVRINSLAEDNQPFARLFGHCHISRWLPIAIKFYEDMHNEPFILRLSRNTIEPILTKKTCDDNEVWVVWTSDPSPSGPRALPAQILEQIKGLETPTDPDVMMAETDVAPVDSNDTGEDEPIFLILTTTRAEAQQSGADVLSKLDQPGVDQASLKLGLDIWLSEPNIRVMPREIKNELFFWCENYSPSWCELIRTSLNDDRETWTLETEVPVDSQLEIPEGDGSDFLRLYGQLANKAFLLKSSYPEEARRLMDRAGNGIKLFADKAHKKEVQVREMEDRLHTIGQQDDQRRANKDDITDLWSLHVQQTGDVPDCLRRLALANCTPEEVQELETAIGANHEDLLL